MKKFIGYGQMYLLLIPIFAVIYTILPQGYFDYGDLKDNIWINIYYSVVTVTTLGYGDITPCNEIAAVLVSLESVLGVILIGLFLNEIAHRQSVEDRAKDKRLKVVKDKLQECDKLIQFAGVIMRIHDEKELDFAVRDFILTIDMHDWRVLERICINYVTDRNIDKFRNEFEAEMREIKHEYMDLRKRAEGEYWG